MKEKLESANDEIDFRMVETDLVEPNDYNPNEMEAEMFETLVETVKAEGMNQPVLVRPHPDKDGHFLIVDGENRWKAASYLKTPKIGVVVVPFDETTARVRTLSFNHIRGQNIPIRLARLLVDLHKEYTAEQIRQMTGIGEEHQQSVLKLLEVPDFNPSDGVRLSSKDVERPIQVTLMLMPDEHGAYTTAMKKAIKLAGPEVVNLIGNEVADYDAAMKKAMGLSGAKLRNLALATICAVFNEIADEKKAEIIKVVHKKIMDKRTADAEAKEQKKLESDKKVSD